MITRYRVVCSCGFEARVKYGKSDQKNVFEVFSCRECKNIFSLFSDDERVCACGNKSLIQYSPNKKDNLNFYKNMASKNKLSKDQLEELENFWNKIKDHECPRCGKYSLKWIAED